MPESDLPTSKARSYDSPLRRRQSALTRELILEALAGAVTQEGLDGVALADVAEQAGVAERTLYRHFPNRQALLEGLMEWLDDRVADLVGRTGLDSADDFEPNIPRIFQAFDELGVQAEAGVIAAFTNRVQTRTRQRRSEQFHAVLDRELAHLDPDRAAAAFAVFRHLVSSTTWFVLRDQHGLDGKRSGEAVAWVVRLMLRDLEAGGGPATASESERASGR